jgi:20S proteasome subunit alpha 6
MEQLDEETDMFQPVTFETLDDMWEGVSDPSAGWTPPVHKLIAADSDPAAPYPSLRCETFKIVAYLDQDRPLSEPKWVRTGHVEDWLNDLFGRMKVGNKKVSSWRGKFEILDPEPVRPFQSQLPVQ